MSRKLSRNAILISRYVPTSSFSFFRTIFWVFRIERGILVLKIFTFHSMLKTSQDNFRDNFRDNFFPSELGSSRVYTLHTPSINLVTLPFECWVVFVFF